MENSEQGSDLNYLILLKNPLAALLGIYRQEAEVTNREDY